MQGTRGLPSVSFIKQALPVCYWIDLFDDKNCISSVSYTHLTLPTKRIV